MVPFLIVPYHHGCPLSDYHCQEVVMMCKLNHQHTHTYIHAHHTPVSSY